MLNAEIVETLLYGCVMWMPLQLHYANLFTIHHGLKILVVGFYKNKGTDHELSYLAALEEIRCESVEKII